MRRKNRIEIILYPAKCQYGCGRYAHYQFNNGNVCCEKSISKCSAIKKIKAERLSKRIYSYREDRIQIVLMPSISCSYGCNQQAHYQFNNGKFCCENHYYKCPAQIRSGSDHLGYGKPAWSRGLTKEDHPGIAAQADKMRGRKQSEEHKRKKGFQSGCIPSKKTRKKQSISAGKRANDIEYKKCFVERMSNLTPEIKRKRVLKCAEILRGRKRPEHSRILKEKYANGELVPWNAGETKETHLSIRRQSRKIREIFVNSGRPFYNKRATEFFKQFDNDFKTEGYYCSPEKGKKEFKILGYSLDYINFDLKLIIEWDEDAHYDADGNLRKRDLERQKEIQEHFSDFIFVRLRQKEIVDFDIGFDLINQEINLGKN